MVQISLEHISKRFLESWAVKGFTAEFKQPGSYVITGSNGSGKSTLLLMLCGFIRPSLGQIRWTHNQQMLLPEDLVKLMAYCTPQLTLDESLTVLEQAVFYFRFKPCVNELKVQQVLELAQLQSHFSKSVGQLSSGMKQRLKLALALCSDTPVLCLDEPLSHLDQQGKEWYSNMLTRFSKNRLVVVASNHNPDEYLKESVKFEL